MTSRASLSLFLAASLLLPAMASAQTVGGKVPPYKAPEKAAPPNRDGKDTGLSIDTSVRSDPFKQQDDLVRQFAASYDKGGRPRLAFYWNRQLTDTLAQWYSDSRTITTGKTANSTEGDLTLKQSGSTQNTVETQRRTGADYTRKQPAETWEWEFQDGFLSPFLQANAIMVDRTAIMRIMGAGAEEIEPRTVEIMALQGMADLLVEVLVADSAKSNTGYELRARILDVKTGRILAMVNSRGLKEWQRKDQAVATKNGFDLPDEDDESFGPERADQRFKATSTGFERKRKPPKLNVIAQNLAYNVMTGMMPRLETTQPAAPIAKAEPAAPIPTDATPPVENAPMPLTPPKSIATPPEAKPAASKSAVPLPEVDAKPLPAPAKAAAAPKTETVPPVAPSADEPPMPLPTKQ